MARYVAKYQKYSITARPQRQIVTIDGVPMVSQEQIICDFHQGDLMAHEVDLALGHFRFTGLPDGLSPIYRLSAFDTDQAAKRLGWDEDTKNEVEAKLEAAVANGVDYFRCEAPALTPPWPKYDTIRSVNRIASKVAEDGHDVESVIAYERSAQNRAEVIEALEAITTAAPAEELIQA